MYSDGLRGESYAMPSLEKVARLLKDVREYSKSKLET